MCSCIGRKMVRVTGNKYACSECSDTYAYWGGEYINLAKHTAFDAQGFLHV